jgi:hypothetical protein
MNHSLGTDETRSHSHDQGATDSEESNQIVCGDDIGN